MTTTRLRRYRAPALLMLLLHLSGCKTMQPLEAPYTKTLPQYGTGKARVTTLAGDRVTIRQSKIEGEVISGEVLDERDRPTDFRWQAPLSDVQEIAVLKTNGAVTFLAVLVTIPAAFVGLVLLACSGGGCDT
jgi:hypothetical protein